MTNMIKTIGKIGFTKLAAGVLSLMVLAPTVQAGDKDERVGFGFRTDSDGNWGFGLDFSKGRYPAPRPVERTERVWVEAVYRTESERIWVAPVYRTVCEKVWVAPVTREVCEKVWIEPVYEYRDVITYTKRGRVIVQERVCVQPGRFVEQRRTVVVAEGRFDTIERQVLVSEGRWENVARQVCVAPARWEDRVIVHNHNTHRDHDYRGDYRGDYRNDRYVSDRGSRYGR